MTTTTNPNPPTPTPADALRTTADRLERPITRPDGTVERVTYLVRVPGDLLPRAAAALRTVADLVDADPLGVSYCTVHAGIANEDDDGCDFRADDDEFDADGEPRPCQLVDLVMRPTPLDSPEPAAP